MSMRDRIAKALTGIRAYHSSPHDFDRFDASKIGTGEGAQVYGHGLYFAENPAVSGQGGEYWKSFRDRFGNVERSAAGRLQEAGFDRQKAIEMAQRDIETARSRMHEPDRPPSNFFNQVIAAQEAQIELLKSGKPVGPRTYEVDIKARPELFLDWDKPITQQDPAVRALSHRVGVDPRDADIVKGAAIYRKAGDYFGPKQAGSDFRVAASEGMRDYGIPGIRYLDAGSRTAVVDPGKQAQFVRQWEQKLAEAQAAKASGEKSINGRPIDDHIKILAQNATEARQGLERPTSNYVVFDPGIVDIVKKYGVVGAPAGMGALAAQDQYGVRQ